MCSLRIMLCSAWAGSRGEKGRGKERGGKHVGSSRFRTQMSAVGWLKVPNSLLSLQHSRPKWVRGQRQTGLESSNPKGF